MRKHLLQRVPSTSSLKDVQVTSGWQVKQELYLLATLSVKHTVTVHRMHNFCHCSGQSPYPMLLYTASDQLDKHIFKHFGSFLTQSLNSIQQALSKKVEED